MDKISEQLSKEWPPEKVVEKLAEVLLQFHAIDAKIIRSETLSKVKFWFMGMPACPILFFKQITFLAALI